MLYNQDMNKKVIVFDLDGVLFDTVNLTNQYFLTSFPTIDQEQMNKILAGNFHKELAKFKAKNKSLEETPEEKKARYAKYIAQKEMSPLYEGIKELLEELKFANYTLTINTSAKEENCVPLLKRAGVAGLFDFVATKEVSISKTEKFKIIADRYNVLPKDLLFITDTLGDVREAKEAGVPTIAVTYGAHGAEFFNKKDNENLLEVVATVPELTVSIKSALNV